MVLLFLLILLTLSVMCEVVMQTFVSTQKSILFVCIFCYSEVANDLVV